MTIYKKVRLLADNGKVDAARALLARMACALTAKDVEALRAYVDARAAQSGVEV